MRRRTLLWPAGVALVVGALLLTDRLLWQKGEASCAVGRGSDGTGGGSAFFGGKSLQSRLRGLHSALARRNRGSEEVPSGTLPLAARRTPAGSERLADV